MGEKKYTGRYVNIPLLVQEINDIFLSDGYDTDVIQHPMPQGAYYYEIRGEKIDPDYGTLFPPIDIKVRGYPNNFTIYVEDDWELFSKLLFCEIDRLIEDGHLDMQSPKGNVDDDSTRSKKDRNQ